MKELEEEASFADVMERFVNRSGYNTCQLSRLSGLPRMTLVNWQQGQTKRPRIWQDLVKLALALHLNQREANELLIAAGYPQLAYLKAQAQGGAEQALLSFWHEEEKMVADSAPPPFQAIPDLATFVGRNDLLDRLEKWVVADDHRSVFALEGIDGVGKTALAAHLAYRVRPHLPDGVLWARLDATNPLTILRQFAETYGRDVTGYEDLHSRSQVVREILANKRALIVLDNVQNSSEIRPLLPPSGSCAVLITTHRLDLYLARGGGRVLVEPFNMEESLALFSKVVGEEMVSKELAIFEEIAEALGHLPLAVDITACRLAYEPNWTAAGFLEQVKYENKLLDNLVHEERAVRSAFAVSFGQLTADQRRFFCALGAFGGEDFSIKASAAVANVSWTNAETNLRTLFCLSMVHGGRLGRYRLIPLMRSFAREKIDNDAVWERMVNYFLSFLKKHEAEADILELEKNNILSAVKEARERGLLNLYPGAGHFVQG